MHDWRPPSGELKGSVLSERQMDRVIQGLVALDVVLLVVCIDMGLHSEGSVNAHRMGQAAKIRASVVGSEFHEDIRRHFNELASRVEHLSIQLYVESILLSIALAHALQRTSLHYAQVEPSTLGSFAWRIDAKDRDLTEYERLWVELVKPLLQTLSLTEPLVTAREFDYSAMAVFENPVQPDPPGHLRARVPADFAGGPFHSYDVRKLVADLSFHNSLDEPGLQFVDVLANAVRRAFNGRLQRRGWRHLGELMVRDFRSGHAMSYIALTPGERQEPAGPVPYAGVYSHLEATARHWEVHPRALGSLGLRRPPE
jgi:hypothetical protein